MGEGAETSQPASAAAPRPSSLAATLRRPYAHILLLWLGPLLGWWGLWHVAWLGPRGGWWPALCGLLFGLWWWGCCVAWLGPPDEGVYEGDEGQLWAASWYRPATRLRAVAHWLLLPAVALCWALGAGGWLALVLLGLGCGAWLPLLCPRVWIGATGIWSLGRDLRYVAFDQLHRHGWLAQDKSAWLVERDAGWPVQIDLPHAAASEALEAAYQAFQSTKPPAPPEPDDTAPVHQAARLWPAAGRGRWRTAWAMALAGGWLWWWAWACWGQDVRIAAPLSWASLLVLGLGLLLAWQWSRWPPTWLVTRRWGRLRWRRDDPASRLFLWITAPAAALACAVSGYGITQQMWGLPALYASPWTLVGWQLMMALSLLVLADPTGAVVWLREDHTQQRWYLRRYGWIEQLDGPHPSQKPIPGKDSVKP